MEKDAALLPFPVPVWMEPDVAEGASRGSWLEPLAAFWKPQN